MLLVDDEEQMRQLLSLYLSQYSYIIDEAADGLEAIEKIQKNEYDLVILDVMMPVMDGWQALKKIREISDVPVIMLTAKGSTEDKVTGLSTGADDYLVKPFDEVELVARIQALLRRAKKIHDEEQILKYKGILIDLTSREVSYQGELINLTQTEFDLLHIFVKHKGRVFTRENLIEIIWGMDFFGEDRTIDSHIKNLREKLKKSGVQENIIQTVWGVGYKAP
ncbi:DNA-binding response regulator [Vulcanibacillus modesticaldus]|uniref:DNA-binding response regulator n=1 Tax=Vulcanibacillus modesticaldus TaxID=337097 RepID=A0A1D2YUU7_9BACI|nr:response regulator transcription factor [Vulcanibacillus modesticaldus]OEF99425.1 DNA-binding response regulator [Vulcanibacillus modesticaldus]